MPLFFVLSGAVFALKKEKDIDTLLKSKVKRLIIPYFLYAWLFMIPLKYLGNFYTKHQVILALRGILYGIDSGHLWFLPTLFWCIICFALLKKTVYKKVKSPYLLLLLSGLVQLLYSYLPFDFFFLKQGLSFLFWFALGFVFEFERKNHSSWNFRTTVFAFLVVSIIEIFDFKYHVLTPFFTICCGSFLVYLFADICSRKLSFFTQKKSWNLVVRNLFYIYLLHDPLEYIVLRIFMNCQFLTTAIGCYAYIFARTILIFILCIFLGECIHKMKGYILQFLNQ